jgi:hypothetical protein
MLGKMPAVGGMQPILPTLKPKNPTMQGNHFREVMLRENKNLFVYNTLLYTSTH